MLYDKITDLPIIDLVDEDIIVTVKKGRNKTIINVSKYKVLLRNLLFFLSFFQAFTWKNIFKSPDKKSGHILTRLDYSLKGCSPALPLFASSNSTKIIISNNNFNKVILEECDKDELSNKEIVWIKYYDSKNNGYNLTDGGYGGDLRSGASNSPEHRKNISASKKGKKFNN